VWSGEHSFRAGERKFFFSDLKEDLKIESILLEAYILVKRCNFTYSDVKGMTKLERMIFLKILGDEVKAQNDAIKQHSSH
jgi:predicted nucleotidyltransferase